MTQALDNFKVKNFGPIRDANVTFGDLTILIGPQASGKSIFLELFKLVQDHDHIISTLKRYNYILGKSTSLPLTECYFGEGLSSLMRSDSEVFVNGMDVAHKLTDTEVVDSDNLQESVFYIPAQRILSIADGRPKNFMEFDLSTPYVIRFFSENLRVFLQGALGNNDIIFPSNVGLENNIADSINASIFHNGKVVMDQAGGQRKMKLLVDGVRLPFMAWSAGQKEFMPLLLAIYCLAEPATSVVKTDDYKWVIIEEPEMGLHPKAIESVIIEILELIRMGYKVILSTHSSLFLDFAWTFNELSNLDDKKLENASCSLFNLSDNAECKSLFSGIRSKKIKTYYFAKSEGDGSCVSDISSLNVMDDDMVVSEWGGLSSFASRASEIVSKYGSC